MNLPRKLILLCSLMGWLCSVLQAAKVPGELSKPENTPPKSDKPVKVYILAGASNMVGFGNLTEANPPYPSIYLSADPSVTPTRMPMGSSALLPHEIFQSKDQRSLKGAVAEIYEGVFDPKVDYGQLTPVKTSTVALGTVMETLPSIEGPHTIVVKAFIDVPLSGTFEIYPGFKESTHAIAEINGTEVYRKDSSKSPVITKIQLEKGIRHPITITYLKGGSAALFLKQVNIDGNGYLKKITQEGRFTWFVDDKGEWTTRKDVTYWEAHLSRGKNPENVGKGGPLTVTSNGRLLGPGVPFGYVMGTYHDEPVLLIDSSQGNRALSLGFRPPSSGWTDPNNKDEGMDYYMLVEGTHKALANIDKIVPDYNGQGYELAGFAWFQGRNDYGKSKEEYEEHLTNLIKDLRREFKAPDMKAVVATVAFDGPRISPEYQAIHAAQMAVGDPKQHPEFKDNVATVDTLRFWRERGVSPEEANYSYNHNAETCVLVGDALGRAMVELLGGEAEKIAMPPVTPQHPDVEKIYAYEITSSRPSDEQVQPLQNALKPIFLEYMIPSWVKASFADRNFKGMTFKDILADEPPKKTPQTAYSQLDAIADYYSPIGITDYEWQNFNPGMKTAAWHYFSFDPPEEQPTGKSNRMRKITYPDGMESWYHPDFNPKAVGWHTGKAPFGQTDGKLAPRPRSKGRCDWPKYCGCQGMPNTLWEKEVLLMTQTFELPPVKDGHVYRIILGGAGCDRSGEGYAIYVNGKLLKKESGGFFRNNGIRGAYIYKDMLSEFKKGKVTISVLNFLRYTHYKNNTSWPVERDGEWTHEPVVPNGQVTLWIQEAKIPELVLRAAKK